MGDLLCAIGQGRVYCSADGVALDAGTLFEPKVKLEDLAEFDEYLERFLDFPIGARRQWADSMLDPWIPGCGWALGCSVTPLLASAAAHRIIIRSTEPEVHRLPWEMASSFGGMPLGLSPQGLCRTIGDLAPDRRLGGPRLKLLLVIARPDGVDDVPHQVVARVLTTLNLRLGHPIDIHVLRPPSFSRFRHALDVATTAGAPFGVVHFDGHGTIDQGASGPVGTFHFEPEPGFDGRVAAPALAAALAAAAVPLVLFNACRSAALGGLADLSSSLATALLGRPGVAAVVAMTHIISATATRLFVEGFYDALLRGRPVSQAVAAGRIAVAKDPSRPTLYGPRQLADWMVPVVYLIADVVVPDLFLVESEQPGIAPIVARDDYIYSLEQAFQASNMVILHGCAGIGKSVIKRDYRRWAEQVRDQDGRRLDFMIEHRFPDDGGLRTLLDRVAGEVLGPDDPALGGDAQALAERVVNAFSGRRALVILEDYDIVSRTIPNQAALVTAQLVFGALVSLAEHSDLQLLIVGRAADDKLGQGFRHILATPLSETEQAELIARCAPDVADALGAHEMRALVARLSGNPGAILGALPLLERFSAGDVIDALSSASGDCARALVGAVNAADLERTVQLFDANLGSLLPLFGVTGAAVDISLINGVFINLPAGHPLKASDPNAAYHLCLSLVGRGLATMTGDRGPVAFTEIFEQQRPDMLCLRPHPFLVMRAAIILGRMGRELGQENFVEQTFLPAALTRSNRAQDIMRMRETDPLADFYLARLALQFDAYEATAEAAFVKGLVGVWFWIYAALAKIRRGAGDAAFEADWAKIFFDRYPEPEDVGEGDDAHGLWLTIAGNEGKRLIDSGNPAAGLDILQRCLNFMPPGEEHAHKSAAMVTYRVVGQALARLGKRSDVEAALGWFDHALELARAADEKFQVANGLYDRACVLYDLGRSGDAMRDCREAMILREGLPDPVETARIATLITMIAKLNIAAGEPSKDVMRGLSAASKAHHAGARIAALLANGDIAFMAGRYTDAERDYRAAAKIAELAGAPDVRVCQRLGNVANQLGQHGLARQWFAVGLEQAKRANSPGMMASLSMSLALAQRAANVGPG